MWGVTPVLNALRAPFPEQECRHMHISGVGDVAVPTPDKLAYYAGLGALAAFGVLEWPIAGAIVAGHLLADQHRFALLRGLGQAAEEA
jgi:uncharacterized membrane protein (DUF4010 family)